MFKYLLFTIMLTAAACTQGPKNYIAAFQIAQGDSNLGTIRLMLYDSTPLHRENFLNLVRQGAYENTKFHRIIKDFMIQGGDIPAIDSSFNQEQTIPAEFYAPYFHKKGALAAARLGDGVNPEKNSSGYQFYIVQGRVYNDPQELTIDLNLLREGMGRLYQDSVEVAQQLDSLRKVSYEAYVSAIYDLIPTIESTYGMVLRKDVAQERIDAYTSIGGVPHLDDEYTVFGEVIEGIELVDSLAATPTDHSDQPLEPIIISRATLEEISQEELNRLRGQ